eukprot:s412_g36.t1
MLELICLSAASTNPFGSSQHGSCKFGISKLDSNTESLFGEEIKRKAQGLYLYQTQVFLKKRYWLHAKGLLQNKRGNLNPKSTAPKEQPTE